MPTDPIVFGGVAAALLAAALIAVALRPQWVVDHPRSVLALLACISVLAAGRLIEIAPLGLRVSVDPSSEPLIRRDDPGIPTYRATVRDFGNDDIYVVAMHVPDDVFSRENLRALARLTREIRRLPGIAELESLAWVQQVQYDRERDLVRVGRLMDEVPKTEAGRQALRRSTLADPLYPKLLVSHDARTTAINITFKAMGDAEFVALGLDARIAQLVTRETTAERRFYIAGRPHVRAQVYHQMVGDMLRLIPIAVAIAALSLGLMSGSIRGMALPLSSCLIATLWTFGALAHLQMNINLITLVLAPLLICVGCVYGVHVFARYEVELQGEPDARAAVLRCLRYSRTPVLTAGFTTCIGFGALLLTSVPATNQLGAFSVLGVASVTLLSLTGIPAALVLLPARVRREARAARAATLGFDRFLDPLLARVADIAVTRSRTVLVAGSVLSLAALASVPRVQVDTDFLTFFVKGSQVRRDFAAINELLAGAAPIYVSVDGAAPGAFRDPSNLRALEKLQKRLEAVAGVSQVLSSVDLTRRVNRALNDDDPAHEKLPEQRAALAEAIFTLPKSQLRRFMTSDHGRANLILRTGEIGSAAVRSLEARIARAIADVELPPGLHATVTANTLLLNHSADGVARNQVTQVGFAATTIFALLVLVFRSLRLAAVAAVPNIVPVLLFFGVLGLGVAPLSLPTSLIGCVALGIAIDDTMHFLVAYRARRDAGDRPEQAARACVAQVGRPIFMTSVMLVIGFLVMRVSGFGTLQEFGILTALTMALCLATDLLLLPALLVRLRA